MGTFEAARKLVGDYKDRNRNEADTRHQIIDHVIHDIFAWPRDHIRVEKFVNEGYVDYLLLDQGKAPFLIVEAKKEGADFDLPQKLLDNPHEVHRCKLRILTSTPAIRAAVSQVATYCLQQGAEYAAITNGKSFIVFRVFVKGREFLDGRAVIIPSLNCTGSSS